MGYVNLGSMPTPKREYSVSFDTLAGGLNLQELDYRINNNESPEMKNMMWREGVLSCRDGQVWVEAGESGNPVTLGEFRSSFDRLWNGAMIVHAGKKLYKVDPKTGESSILYMSIDDSAGRGSFFPYQEKLYYKAKGYYIVVNYDYITKSFSAEDVEGYVPVTYINCSPFNGSGTVYQPENRLSDSKTLWYNATFVLSANPSSGLSVSVENSYFRIRINTPGVYTFAYNGSSWRLNGEEVNLFDYGITLGGTPENGSTIVIDYRFINEYYLPIPTDSVEEITVDDVIQKEENVRCRVTSGVVTASLDEAKWRSYITESGTYTFVFDYDADPSTWRISGEAVNLEDYGITVTGEPAANNEIVVNYTRGDFWLDPDARKVVFFVAPPVTYPETNNTVHVTYAKENEAAMNAIMDCSYSAVYGGTGSLCIIFAGSSAQPNAYFWNGQTDIAMDASYFPMDQYQLAGDGIDPITGFGKQQGYLIIFKTRSIGRTTLGTVSVEGRTTIDLPYTAINAKIGCDLPYTIQLVENNLVWCNTDSGVHFLANTSSAYENNVVCISDKINYSGNSWNPGLMHDIRNAPPEAVSSHDDERRYWLVVNGHAWLWDYYVSNYKSPSWFFFDNINGLGFVQELSDIWHFDSLGRLTHFERVYFDYDPSPKGNGAIDKVLRFATQYFGTYDNYKTVNSVIINMRSDTNSVVDLTYMTDYEVRKDPTPLTSISWTLVPRNLTYRNLSGSGFAHVYRRKPHCRRIQYFTMRIENKTPDMDMSVVSAQIYYTYQGRQR